MEYLEQYGRSGQHLDETNSLDKTGIWSVSSSDEADQFLTDTAPAWQEPEEPRWAGTMSDLMGWQDRDETRRMVGQQMTADGRPGLLVKKMSVAKQQTSSKNPGASLTARQKRPGTWPWRSSPAKTGALTQTRRPDLDLDGPVPVLTGLDEPGALDKFKLQLQFAFEIL